MKAEDTTSSYDYISRKYQDYFWFKIFVAELNRYRLAMSKFKLDSARKFLTTRRENVFWKKKTHRNQKNQALHRPVPL